MEKWTRSHLENHNPAAKSGGVSGHGGTGLGTPLKGGSQPHPEFHRPRLDADLAALAGRVQRLTVSHRDPERFHLDKSEIAHQLRQLAQGLR